MTDPTLRVTPIAFKVKARARVGWPSQDCEDTRSCGLHVISPLHSALLQPPHWSAPTTPDPTPWTSLHCIEYPHDIPHQNTSQHPWETWPPPEIMWASHDD